jgi:site-specific DNA-methyltransferase (adenine-specific)
VDWQAAYETTNILGGIKMILIGDVREKLKELPDQSVNCCVTSPPYWGLRDYGNDGQIGLEQTPDAFIAELVAVFSEVKRVLRDDGTLWVNIGDCYGNGSLGRNDADNDIGGRGGNKLGSGNPGRQGSIKTVTGLKQKNLVGIPWMLAFALRADGWYLRQDIIWHKPNPMPESVTDRCTKAHEYIFLLSKSPKYYFDSEAMKERGVMVSGDSSGSRQRNTKETHGVGGGNTGISKAKEKLAAELAEKGYSTRNKRSVWTIATRPFKGAHFATFPPALIEPCILAGCPEGGTVLDPFFGAGTTGLVAQRHNRKWIGCELNPEYAAIAQARIESESTLFTIGDTQ